jgi:hypothetical protein
MQLLKTHHNLDKKVTQITLVWTCTENGRNYNSQIVLYTNLETTRLTGRPRNRWQDEVREMASRERYVEEAPENSKKSSYSAHANGMNE